jgi:hypothetical protein
MRRISCLPCLFAVYVIAAVIGLVPVFSGGISAQVQEDEVTVSEDAVAAQADATMAPSMIMTVDPADVREPKDMEEAEATSAAVFAPVVPPPSDRQWISQSIKLPKPRRRQPR